VIFVVAALILLPVVEIAVMIQVGSWIGVWETVALLLIVSIGGAWLAKRQGAGAWRRLRDDLGRGRVPTPALVDGALLFAAGVLFLIPGFVTDVVAVLLLVPPVRALCRGALARRYGVLSTAHPTGDTTRVSPGSAYDVNSRVRDPRPDPPELGP
jgi:UPF0716 protein FxsA